MQQEKTINDNKTQQSTTTTTTTTLTEYNRQLDLFNKIHSDFCKNPIYAHPNTTRRIRPAFDTYEIALARTRLVHILKNVAQHDLIEPLKKMPALDTVEWAFFHPYTVDCYAEKYSVHTKDIVLDKLVVDLHRVVHVGNSEINREDRPILLPDYDSSILGEDDDRAINNSHKSRLRSDVSGGIGMRGRRLRSHTIGEGIDNFVIKRGIKKKKDLICRHYEISPARYIQINYLHLYHRPVMPKGSNKHGINTNTNSNSSNNRTPKLLSDDEILELLGVEPLQQVTG